MTWLFPFAISIWCVFHPDLDLSESGRCVRDAVTTSQTSWKREDWISTWFSVYAARSCSGVRAISRLRSLKDISRPWWSLTSTSTSLESPNWMLTASRLGLKVPSLKQKDYIHRCTLVKDLLPYFNKKNWPGFTQNLAYCCGRRSWHEANAVTFIPAK